MTVDVEARPGGGRRSIGPAGTVARVLVGSGLVASVVEGHAAGGWRPWSWVLGLVGFPVVVLAWQRWRARRDPSRLDATGPIAHALNSAVFAALYLTTWYAPALSVTSDAALLFYGASMLVAATRGSAGCEVVAISNWALGRDDQIGCALFWPIDTAEHHRHRDQPLAANHPTTS